MSDMPDYDLIIDASGVVVVACPLLLAVVLGLPSLLDRKLAEEATTRLVQAATVVGLLAAVGVLASMLVARARGTSRSSWANWVVIPHATTSRSSSSSTGCRSRS